MLGWARPLLDQGEYDLSSESVEAFLSPGGRGRELRAELDRLYPSNPEILGWMPYWEKWYLAHRGALPVNSNPFYLLEPGAERLGVETAELAARAVCAILDFYGRIRAETLERDLWREHPLSMSQYGDILGVTRVPGQVQDVNIPSDSDWIAVICRGRLFRQRVLSPDGKILPGEGLARSFSTILEKCLRGEPEKFPLPLLTCLPRTRWAELRKELLHHSPDAARAFEVMEKSLFVLCLDPPETMNDEALSRGLLHGEPGNRWFDKSLQLVMLGEGRMGLNFEHSARDGTPMGRFVRSLCEGTQRGELTTGEAPGAEEVTPVSDPLLREAVEEARIFADRLFQGVHLNLVRFGNFGKDRIKELHVSPDGFLQTALFLAQDRAWGKCRSTFESVMLRTFHRGRTEGMRPFNGWTRKFLESMRTAGEQREEPARLLREALRVHSKRIALCMAGEGIDGQLGLLQAIAEGRIGQAPLESLPDLFKSPAWKVLQDIGISTSTTSGEGIEAAGYGPAVPDGLAVRYLQRSDHLILSVTGLAPGERNRQAFLEQLPGALADMERVLS